MSLLENASRATRVPWYARSSEPGLSEERQPSPAGPITDEIPATLETVPHVGAGRTLQTIRLGNDIGGTSIASAITPEPVSRRLSNSS